MTIVTIIRHLWLLLIILVYLSLSACGAQHSQLSYIGMADGEVLLPSEVNKKLSLYDGKVLIIKGYIRIGFNGRHVQCSISDDKRSLAVDSNIWVVLPNCYNKKLQFNQGYGVVKGQVSAGEGEMYISGGLYPSMLSNILFVTVDGVNQGVSQLDFPTVRKSTVNSQQGRKQ